MKYIIQSYVDLITNSSTSVFTWASSPEAVKEIINAVLKSAGSDVEEKIYHYMVNNCGSLSLDEFAKSHNESDPEWYYDSSYVIESKDPSNVHNAAILNKINGLFDYDASYC